MKEKIIELLEQTSASELDKREILNYIQELEDDSLMLSALQANGVDNWIWYGDAMDDDYYKWKEEEEEEEE